MYIRGEAGNFYQKGLEDYAREATGDGLAITGVDYSVTEVVIPAKIGGQRVKELRSMSLNATGNRLEIEGLYIGEKEEYSDSGLPVYYRGDNSVRRRNKVSIYNIPANRLTRLLDLGNQYLEEENYEQAAITFDKAIAIDGRCVEAYEGGIKAYQGLDDEEGLTDIYERALDLMARLVQSDLEQSEDAAVEIYLTADKVYSDNPEKVVQILEDGIELIEDRRLMGESFPAPACGSKELVAVINRTCAYTPKMRYSNAYEMRRVLESILKEEDEEEGVWERTEIIEEFAEDIKDSGCEQDEYMEDIKDSEYDEDEEYTEYIEDLEYDEDEEYIEYIEELEHKEVKQKESIQRRKYAKKKSGSNAFIIFCFVLSGVLVSLLTYYLTGVGNEIYSEQEQRIKETSISEQMTEETNIPEQPTEEAIIQVDEELEGDKCYFACDYADAIKHYEAVGDNPRAWYKIAFCYYALGAEYSEDLKNLEGFEDFDLVDGEDHEKVVDLLISNIIYNIMRSAEGNYADAQALLAIMMDDNRMDLLYGENVFADVHEYYDSEVQGYDYWMNLARENGYVEDLLFAYDGIVTFKEQDMISEIYEYALKGSLRWCRRLIAAYDDGVLAEKIYNQNLHDGTSGNGYEKYLDLAEQALPDDWGRDFVDEISLENLFDTSWYFIPCMDAIAIVENNTTLYYESGVEPVTIQTENADYAVTASRIWRDYGDDGWYKLDFINIDVRSFGNPASIRADDVKQIIGEVGIGGEVIQNVNEQQDKLEDTGSVNSNDTGQFLYDEARNMLNLVNQYRASSGLAELAWNPDREEWMRALASRQKTEWEPNDDFPSTLVSLGSDTASTAEIDFDEILARASQYAANDYLSPTRKLLDPYIDNMAVGCYYSPTAEYKYVWFMVIQVRRICAHRNRGIGNLPVYTAVFETEEKVGGQDYGELQLG